MSRLKPIRLHAMKILLGLLLSGTGAPQAADLPAEIVRQLPTGYDVIALAHADFAGAARAITIVALAKHGEAKGVHGNRPAAARPLLLFTRQPDGSVRQTGRNDVAVLRADEGGMGDPFDYDGRDGIAVMGRYFTVENGVEGGQHWTDYITFRFDDALGTYVFDNERVEYWKLNPNDAPGADALVRDGPQHLTRGNSARPVRFQDWRRSR